MTQLSSNTEASEDFVNTYTFSGMGNKTAIYSFPVSPAHICCSSSYLVQQFRTVDINRSFRGRDIMENPSGVRIGKRSPGYLGSCCIKNLKILQFWIREVFFG